MINYKYNPGDCIISTGANDDGLLDFGIILYRTNGYYRVFDLATLVTEFRSGGVTDKYYVKFK